jgi:phosphoribosylanthranilate isomerase
MIRTKICGIRNVRDAIAAAEAGADAIGLNFFSKSRRFVEPTLARQITSALPAHICKVGVFVNHDATEIVAIANTVGLDAVQLHGDEAPAIIAQLPAHVQVVRAMRCGNGGLTAVASYLRECGRLGRMPDAVLIDADAGTEFGGTGKIANWDLIAAERTLLDGMPLILAGGLTPANVSAAIAAVRPTGVDVASGVEREAGVKDHLLIQQFVSAATKAFETK